VRNSNGWEAQPRTQRELQRFLRSDYTVQTCRTLQEKTRRLALQNASATALDACSLS